MSRRIRFCVAFGAMSLVAAVAAPAVLAAGDTEDHLSPAHATVKDALKRGTMTSFTGKLGTLTVTSTCTTSTFSFKTPAHGLGPAKASAPAFSGCTDNLHGTDTVATNGKWAVKFVDAAKDEKAEKAGDQVVVTIPKAGATLVSSLAPTCVITVAPSGPVKMTGAYDDVKTATFTNVSLPVSTSATCPGGAGTSTGTFSATYVAAHKVKDVS